MSMSERSFMLLFFKKKRNIFRHILTKEMHSSITRKDRQLGVHFAGSVVVAHVQAICVTVGA